MSWLVARGGLKSWSVARGGLMSWTFLHQSGSTPADCCVDISQIVSALYHYGSNDKLLNLKLSSK